MNTQVDPPRMNAKRLRVASGLIFALAIAMLGPVFADVSSQSGNGYSSGHHTFTNEGSLRRGAFVDVPASKVGEPHYTFWVWTEVFNGVALDPGAQHVNQGVGGEAVDQANLRCQEDLHQPRVARSGEAGAGGTHR